MLTKETNELKLGDEVMDRITSRTGIIVAITTHLHGESMFWVTHAREGGPHEVCYFANRLIAVIPVRQD